jgi:hypothetical protein
VANDRLEFHSTTDCLWCRRVETRESYLVAGGPDDRAWPVCASLTASLMRASG